MVVCVQNTELVLPQFCMLTQLTTIQRLHSVIDCSGLDELCWMLSLLWYLE